MAHLASSFDIEGIIGEGAMGVVYRGRQISLDRTVAIKVPTHASPELAPRFLREGRLLANLEHPNLVRVIDAGQDAGRLYIVFEYVEGRSLEELLASERLPVSRAIRIVSEILCGLGYAHKNPSFIATSRAPTFF